MMRLKNYIDYYKKKNLEREYPHNDNATLLNEYKYDFETFISYSFSDYLKIFYAGASIYSCEFYSDLILKYNEYFDSIEDDDYPGLKHLFDKIEQVHEEGRFNEFIIEEKSYSKMFEDFNKLDYRDGTKQFLMVTFSDEYGKFDFEAYNDFLNEFLNDRAKTLFRAIVEIYRMKCIVEKTMKADARKRTKKKVIEDFSGRLLKTLDIIKHFRNKFETEQKELERSKKKINSILTDLERELDTGKIINVEKYKKLLGNSKLLTEIILYNTRFQNKKYEEALEEKEMLNYSKVTNLEKELIKYNIKLDISKINISLDEAKNKILELVNTKEIKKYSNVLLYFINNISINVIKKLAVILTEKTVTEEFVLDELIGLSEIDLINFINNIKLFNDNKININNVIKYNKSILFYNNIKLKELLNVYKLYNIKIDNECYNYEWLENDMSYIIDKFIEIGHYELIKNNLSLLNSNSNMIVKRCILYLNLNNPLLNEQNKLRGSLRKEENFILSDRELDETIISNFNTFIPSDVLDVLNNSNIYGEVDIDLSFLEEFKINKFTYKFNKLLISKNKILNNINKLINSDVKDLYKEEDLILYSIIYNYSNTLYKSDIDFIKNIINKKVKKLIK